MLNNLQQFEQMLIAATSLKECDKALSDYLTRLGITTFSFTYYSFHPQTSNPLKYDFCSENFTGWHNHYLEKKYNDIDSTLDFAFSNDLPVFWDLKVQFLQAKNEAERQMRLDSIEFGAETGLSIPIHGPQNNFAILLLVQMKNENVSLKAPSLQYAGFMAAHLYYHYLQNHLLDEITELNAFQLTAREIQCLTLLAKEYSVKKIAQTLEITERTVNFHMQKINKKLGTKNKYQSLSKAINYKLITI